MDHYYFAKGKGLENFLGHEIVSLPLGCAKFYFGGQ